jgi:hypothetical protein
MVAFMMGNGPMWARLRVSELPKIWWIISNVC